MTDRQSTRRQVIRAAGAAALFGLAGCSSQADQSSQGSQTSTTTSGGTETTTSTPTATPTTTPTATPDAAFGLRGPLNGDDLPTDTTPEDGYPPEFDTVPQRMSVDPSSFDTLTRSGVEIKLVPTDVAYYWYARGEARFADARSESEFAVSHIFGAALSPAGDGRDLPDDPALQWPKGDRIVTYCDCPHHLSSLRAASLKSRGYEAVYALDEGVSAWREHNLPMAGEDVGRVPPVRVIEGSVPRLYAGGTAWAYHTGSNQREATTIAEDGSYELELRFVNLTASSEIRVETPAYSLTAPVGELTSGTVTADGSLRAPSGGTTSGTTTNGTATNGMTTNETATNETTTGGTGTSSGTTTDEGASSTYDLRGFLP